MLSDPGIGGVADNGRMHNLSGMMGNDDEDVNGPKEKIMGNREVTSPHLPSMILEKCTPGLHTTSSSDETYLDANARGYPVGQCGELTARIGSDEPEGLDEFGHQF